MKLTKSALLVALALSFTGAAMASVGGAGIKGTRHDFATRTNFLGSQVSQPGVADQVGQCSFCHTPHSAQSTALLWNKKMSANTFTWDDATTSGGTNFASMAPGYKGATVKCLACHDGSVAIGDVSIYKAKVNASVNTFKVGDQPTDYTGKTWGTADARPQYKIGTATGLMAGTHPVGMAYPFGQAVNTYNNTTTGSEVVLAEFDTNPHQVTPTSTGGGLDVILENGNPAKPLSTGLGSSNSLIKLYNDVGGVMKAGTAAGTTGMECSTCHDAHNKQTTDDWLLRARAQGSTKAQGYICLQCHIK